MSPLSSSGRVFPHVVTLSSKGQVTLPALFRRCYGIRPGTTIAIEVKDDAMIITPARSTVEQRTTPRKETNR